MRRIALGLTVLVGLLLGVQAAPALAANANFLGTWDPSPGIAWTVTSQQPGGSCEGFSADSAFTFTGCQVSGDNYEFTVEEEGYSSHNHGTIEGDTLTGEFNDTFGHNVPYTAVREGGVVASIAGEPSVALPESGTATEAFKVSLSEASSETVEVSYETQNGTATVEHEDYTAAAGTLTFQPGETTKEIDVTVDAGDGKDEEADETYTVKLTRATGGANVAPAATAATGAVTLPGFSGVTVDGHKSPLPGATLTLTGRPDKGAPVTREVTTGAGGAYTIAADPGEYSIYAHGVPPGQPTGLKWTPGAACPGKPSGAYCEKLILSTYGKKLSAKVDFAYGTEDPEAENLEVIQAVQKSTFDAGGPQITLPSGAKASSFSYSGVGLVAASKTIVRLYGANNGALTAESIPAQLRAFSGSGSSLTELPGGPIAPLDNNLDLKEAPQFEPERAFSANTYNFVLPEAWTKTGGPITLVGTVDPEQKAFECPKCRDNDNVALTGVAFTEVPALKFIPLSLQWKEAGKSVAPADPVKAVTQSWPYWPLPEGGLQAVGAPVAVDLSEALESVAARLSAMPAYKGKPLGYQTTSLVGCLGWNAATTKLNEACVNLIEPKIFAAEKAGLPASAGSTVAVGVYNDTGYSYGVLGAANMVPGTFSYVPESKPAVVVHEMMHMLGFKHSGCTSPSDEEPWPANPLGQASLLGYGVNREGGGSGGIGRIYSTEGTAAGQGWHDIMSYCEPIWPSAFNWERTLLRLAKNEEPKPFGSYPGFSGTTATSSSVHAASAGDMVTVQSINVAGKQMIAEIEPGAHAEANTASGYTFEATNAHGKVIARASAKAIHAHADVFEAKPAPDDEITILEAELPAKDIAGISLMQGKHVVSRVKAPGGRLTLTVQKVPRRACRRSGPLQLKFRAHPGGASFRSVRVLADTGKHPRPIEVGSHSGAITLKAGTIPKGERKLLVEFSDGFAAIRRTVSLPKGCKAG